MTIPKIDLLPDETIIWDAPIDSQLMNAANNKGRMMYGGAALAMLLLALYLLLLFANGFWGANENVGSARLVATVITGPAILVALVAIWAFVERYRMIGAHTMPAHYVVTNQRSISLKTDGDIFDDIAHADISHTSIDGKSETQVLLLARAAQEDVKDEDRKPPFLFVHLEDLNAVKALIDRHIPEDD